jgi:hypothetical protein
MVQFYRENRLQYLKCDGCGKKCDERIGFIGLRDFKIIESIPSLVFHFSLFKH